MDVTLLGNSIKRILMSDYQHKELKDELASFLWRMATGTFYRRGQAAITEWILMGLSAVYDKQLEWSEDWQPPHPNYDQQALMAFNRQKFIKSARKKMHLRQVEKPKPNFIFQYQGELDKSSIRAQKKSHQNKHLRASHRFKAEPRLK